MFRKLYAQTDLVHKFDTSVSHILKGLFTNCNIGLVSRYFMFSPIHCNIYIT